MTRYHLPYVRTGRQFAASVGMRWENGRVIGIIGQPFAVITAQIGTRM